ncbi:MAG: hypothetical protein ACP5Q4_00705 [Candidatus Caldatribacteriaceae bacterium]
MRDGESSIRFSGYEVLKFQFEREKSAEKRGWSFYPEVQISPLQSVMRGEVLLSASAFFEEEKGKFSHIFVLLRGFFQGENVTREDFEQYCLVKGSAHLVPVLRALVNDFLERVRSSPSHAL